MSLGDGTGATQTKLHLRRLVELEYVLVHRAPHGQGVVYELVYTGDADGDDAVIERGLRDAQSLGAMRGEEGRADDGERSAAVSEWSGVGRPAVGVRSGDRSTPKHELAVIRDRWHRAKVHYAAHYAALRGSGGK